MASKKVKIENTPLMAKPSASGMATQICKPKGEAVGVGFSVMSAHAMAAATNSIVMRFAIKGRGAFATK